MRPENSNNDTSVEIMIVEDSPTQAAKLQYILEEKGYYVSVAGNGKEALVLLEKKKPAMIISDVVMPEMDGYKMCYEIKHVEKLRDIPVILLTSLSDPEDVICGLDAGADNYVTKPYDEKLLLSRVKSLLEIPVYHKDEGDRKKLEIAYAGKHYFITSGRQQILNLLLSTYENAVQQNTELIKTQDKLKELNTQLEKKLYELEVSEERFSILVQMLPDIVYRMDKNGYFTFVNDAISRLGFKPNELIGKHFSEIILPVDVETVSRKKVLPKYKGTTIGDKDAPKLFDERRTGDRITTDLEVRLKTKTYKGEKPALIESIGKEVIIAEINSSGMYDIVPDKKKKVLTGSLGIIKGVPKEDTFIGTVGAIRDITKRKMTENALFVSEERFRSLVNTAGSAIIYLSADNRILEWNLEAERIYGRKREDVLEKNYLELFDQKDMRDQVDVKMKEALSGKPVKDLEVSVKAHDGSECILQWNITRLLDAKDGPAGLIAVGQDVTERKQAEREKINARAEADAAKIATETIESMMDAVVITDLEGKIIQFNKGFTESFGWGREMIGEYLAKCAAEGDVPKVKEGIKTCILMCRLRDFEYTLLTRDKREIPILVNMTLAIGPEGKPTKIIAVLRDITSRKHYENILQERHSEISAMHEISSVISSTISMEELLSNILRKTTELEVLNIEPNCTIFLIEGDRMKIASHYGHSEEYVDLHKDMKVGDCLCGLAAKMGEMIISRNANKDIRHTLGCYSDITHGHISIPIKIKGKVTGVICFLISPDYELDERKEKIFLSIGDQLGIAIDNVRLYEETKALSLSDPLTGLANRRLMNVILERNIAIANRFNNPLSAVMLDIDYFKKYNDKYGHTAGDKLLAKIAYHISKEVRETDLAVRYGGEEFFLILTDTDLTKASEIAERIRKNVEVNAGITVSLGISEYHKGMKEKETLINKADKALYQAKQKGRNRVEIMVNKNDK